MTAFFLIGTLLGLSAGISPGPLLTLLVSETLRHDSKAGIKVAISPIITDLPIILLTVIILGRLSGFHSVLGVISLIGGVVLLAMGYKSFRLKNMGTKAEMENPKSLTKGVVVNLLNPHPYLFWFSVGAPMITKSMKQGVWVAGAFILSFYLFLIGSKVLLALLVGQSKSFLTGNWYLYTLRFLAVLLCLFAAVLIREGLSLLKII
ncbi:MAG: LysE family translocator [Deltaproteobacteria bacterium]|nr:LysE family translocator [Deltaproteobacteria bacterium]